MKGTVIVKQFIAAAICIVVLFASVHWFEILNAVTLLLLGGVVPGTSYVLSPSLMMILLGLIGFGVTTQIVASEYIKFRRDHPHGSHQSARKHLPRKRYSQI